MSALREQQIGVGDRALVIAAGPSIRRQSSLETLTEVGFNGAVIATESVMRTCLLQGIIPDLVVTVDHVSRIVRWFGDPELSRGSLEDDDYFRRQEQDAAFASELAANEQISLY